MSRKSRREFRAATKNRNDPRLLGRIVRYAREHGTWVLSMEYTDPTLTLRNWV